MTTVSTKNPQPLYIEEMKKMTVIPSETELKPVWADSEKRLGRITQGADLELHIKETKIENQTFINIRDYIPSAKQYGKGTLIRRHDLDRVLEILNQYAGDSNWRGGPVAGQQSFTEPE